MKKEILWIIYSFNSSIVLSLINIILFNNIQFKYKLNCFFNNIHIKWINNFMKNKKYIFQLNHVIKIFQNLIQIFYYCWYIIQNIIIIEHNL